MQFVVLRAVRASPSWRAGRILLLLLLLIHGRVASRETKGEGEYTQTHTS